MPDTSRCLLLLEVAVGDDEEVIGHVGQRDPHLLAAEHVAVALLDGHGLHAAHVAAGRGLGEAEGGDLLALGLRHEVALLLVLGAPASSDSEFRPTCTDMDDAQRGVDVLQFLAGETEADVVHARAAVLGRDADAQQAEGGHLRQDRRVEAVLAVQFRDVRARPRAPPIRGRSARASRARRSVRNQSWMSPSSTRRPGRSHDDGVPGRRRPPRVAGRPDASTGVARERG